MKLLDFFNISKRLREAEQLLVEAEAKRQEYLQKNASNLLLRNLLGSIHTSDVPEEKQDEAARKDYVATASASYLRVIKPLCERFIKAQQEWMARETMTIEQFMVGRGTINGLFLVLEELEKLHGEHMKNITPEPEFDRSNPIAELFPEEKGRPNVGYSPPPGA